MEKIPHPEFKVAVKNDYRYSIPTYYCIDPIRTISIKAPFAAYSMQGTSYGSGALVLILRVMECKLFDMFPATFAI